MKYSGIEWIGEIPDSWNIRKVKQCFYISKEQAHEENPTILSLARAGVKVRDISNNEGQLAASYDNYNPVQPGDLLLNPMDLYSGANCSLSEVSGVISPAYVNLRKHVELNPKYFDYYFKTQYWAMAMFAHGKGVSFDNRWTMNAEAVLNYYLPFPTYEEQNRIVETINKKVKEIDSLIEIENQQIDKLKDYKRAVITEAVTRGLDKDAPLKDSGVEWIGLIPKEWNICRFKNVITIANGKEIEVDGGEIPVYGSGGIFKYTNKPLFTGLSLLLGRKGTIDKPMLVSGSFWTVDTMFYTSEIRNIDEKFLFYCAKTLINFDFYKSGSVLPSMTQIELNNIYITYPDIKTQKEIAVFLDNKCAEIDALISIKQNKIDDLNEYKKSLIYEYVTGKKEAH